VKLFSSDGPEAMRWPVGLAALVPFVVVVCGLGSQIAVGTRWETDRLNPADAILFLDFAQAVRSIEKGADPNRAYPVSATDRDAAGVRMTPLEAAVQVEDSTLVRALMQYGARAEAPERQRLGCLALTLGDQGTVKIFHEGPIEDLVCD
jgi:hypothetical protein